MHYLSEVERLKDNTVGRYIKFVKTIVRDARKKGLKTNPQIDDVNGFRVKTEKHTLSFAEISKIKNTFILDDSLTRAKQWLIVGCYTGQRVSDLLRMHTSMIQEIKGYKFIIIEQVKTGKVVQIPIHKEVEEIMSQNGGEFPQSFGDNVSSASAVFNKKIKIVCKLAGIDTPTTDYLFNGETKRKERTTAPKYKYVSSHICRRSFATNFYTIIATPLLMNITAHSTESMFLEYIGLKGLDYSLQLAEVWNK